MLINDLQIIQQLETINNANNQCCCVLCLSSSCLARRGESLKQILHFPQGFLDELCKPVCVGLVRTVVGRDMEEDDMVSLDDIGHPIAILSNLHTQRTHRMDLVRELMP